MRSMKSVAFLVQEILHKLFSIRNFKCSITANVGKIKSVPDNITFIFDLPSEKVITFVRIWLSLWIKVIVNLRKVCFF